MTQGREEKAADRHGQGWQDARVGTRKKDREWGGDFVIQWRDKDGKVQNTPLSSDS